LIPIAATFSLSEGATLFDPAKDCQGITEENPAAAAAAEDFLIKARLVCFIYCDLSI
jgi:hypothetical protein